MKDIPASPPVRLDEQESRQEAHRRHHVERIGLQDWRCPTCGESDPCCAELHHIAGRRFDATTIPLCANCHRKVTDAQQDHPPFAGGAPTTLERIGRFLLGIADLLALAIEKLREFGRALIAQARAPHTDPAQSA